MEMANMTQCPAPFLAADNYPLTGGAIGERFCTSITNNVTCCLPCPATQWVFSDKFDKQAPAANYVSIVSLIFNVFLLLTYWLLPEEKSHRHYLSVGLTVSSILLAIAFIIPIGTKPDLCHNDITPADMHTDVGCAWTGALLLAGAMGLVVCILLRSIWTALRIIFDFKHTDLFKWISVALGVGLPALFLAICMGADGVSYRFYNVCFPNGQNAFVTWFVWLVAFAGLSAVILILTIVYCLWKFAVSALAGGPRPGHSHTDTSTSATSDPAKKPSKRAIRRRRRVEWSRIKKVLILQWRTILLAFVILNETIFYGLVFVQSSGAAQAAAKGVEPPEMAWFACLIRTRGDSEACLDLSGGFGLSEPRVIATLLLISLLGPTIFLLQLRWSMFTGWYELLRDPKQILTILKGRRPSVGSQDFIMAGSPKHMSLQMPLGSEEPANEKPTGHAAKGSIDKALVSPTIDDPEFHKVDLDEEEEEKEKAHEQAGVAV